MAVIQLKSFSGEIPRLPAHALPENAAQTALSCDFAYGELRGIKDAEAITPNLSTTPAAIWTESGTTFYAWSVNAEVALSPVINDTHKRLYYCLDDGLGVHVVAMAGGDAGTLPSQTGTTPSGYKVGVPGPSHAMFDINGVPGSELQYKLLNYDATAVAMEDPRPSSPTNGGVAQPWYPVIAGLNLAITFFYEHNGVKYQETSASIYSDNVPTPNPAAFCTLQSVSRYEGGKTLDTNVCGRDFHVSYPAKILAPTMSAVPVVREWDADANSGNGGWVASTASQPVETSPATPSEALPVVQVTGTIKGVQAFSVYSDNSFFTNSRGVYGVKLYANKAAGSNLLQCGLKYGIQETRSYVYTNVNIFGEESKPSNPLTIDVGYGQTVMLYVNFQKFSSGNNYAPIDGMRTYATNTSSQGNTDWYLATEGLNLRNVAAGQLPTDAGMLPPNYYGAQITRPENYGERLATQDNDMQPAGATGLCALPNGIFACFRNTAGGSRAGQNEVHFSEPYHPSAWPAKYVQTFPWDVVAIKPQGNGLVVVTKGHPYYVYGAHPESMSSTKLQAMQAGVSKRSIVDIGSHVIYASNDGLVAVQNTDVNLAMSQKFFTREKWRTLFGGVLDKLALAYHDGNLIGYFTDGVTGGFTIRLDEASGTYTGAVKGGTCHCVSPLNDTLYFSGVAGAPSRLFAYAAGGVQQAYTWHSKDFIMPMPVCLGAGHIILDDAQSGTVTLTIYADGVEKQVINVTASGYFRLKSGFMARRWSVKIAAGRTVKELYLSTSMAELSRV